MEERLMVERERMEERLVVKREDGRQPDIGRERMEERLMIEREKMEERQNLEGTAWCGQYVK